MAENPKETAEQKLLKMIETASSGKSVSTKAKRKLVKKQDVLGIVKTSNRLLILGVLGAAAFLAYEVQSGVSLLGKKFNFDSGKTSLADLSDKGTWGNDVKAVSYYLNGSSRRNIFKPYEEKAVSVTPETTNNVEMVNKAENLRLVGVSWLDSVESASALIEDREKKVTYFLKTGEKIDDMQVKTIYADSVELGYEKEEFILKYDKSQM